MIGDRRSKLVEVCEKGGAPLSADEVAARAAARRGASRYEKRVGLRRYATSGNAPDDAARVHAFRRWLRCLPRVSERLRVPAGIERGPRAGTPLL